MQESLFYNTIVNLINVSEFIGLNSNNYVYSWLTFRSRQDGGKLTLSLLMSYTQYMELL
jgi:hypothetical protein